jgi:hypothetical protein
MDNFFNSARFSVLFRKHLKEDGRKYVIQAISIWGILMLIYGIIIMSSLHYAFPADEREALFIMGLPLIGAFFSASFYQFLSNKAKSIRFLQVPATHAEKLVIGFIVTQIFFILVFLGIFYLTDWIMCAFYNAYHKLPERVEPGSLHRYTGKLFDLGSYGGILTLILFFITSSIAHYGSLVFEKNAFAKTAIITIFVAAVLFWSNNTFMTSLIPEEVMPKGKFYVESLRIGSASDIKGIVALPLAWNDITRYFIPLILYISFWAASYFRLKEKQV